MGNSIERGDKVITKWWSSIDVFMREQEEIERDACRRRGHSWSIRDDKNISRLRKMMENLKVMAWNDPEKYPKCNPELSKIYKHPETKKLWRMQFYVWIDGRVEFRHNEVADSLRIHTEFADNLK